MNLRSEFFHSDYLYYYFCVWYIIIFYDKNLHQKYDAISNLTNTKSIYVF